MIRDRDKGQFQLVADFNPQGDQPQAIEKLVKGLEASRRHQVLLGVTGSGKTFTMANVIAKVNKPALVIAPNKTLAAQLYNEFRDLFPENAVRYFVSYYDYYQPEAYVPSTDTYIEKDASINDEIDKLRHSATKALLERRDTLIVASVSCIYGLGSPEAYFDLMVYLEEGTTIPRDQMLRKLVDIQYQRSDYDFYRGTFRVRGDIVEVFPAYEDSSALRIEFFDDTIEAIQEIDPIRGKIQRRIDKACIYPASHHVTVPQIGGMYRGDRSRKETLVEYGFRLPSALDNRPLNFEEFEAYVNQIICVSATPAEYEMTQSRGAVVEQLIRPTGLTDPEV